MVHVTNPNSVGFGTASGAITITHARVRRASDNGQPMVKQLASPIQIQAGNAIVVNAGSIDFNYPNGEFTNAHYRELIDGYWGATGNLGIEVDLMTSASQVVTDAGYSQQTVSAWTITADSD